MDKFSKELSAAGLRADGAPGPAVTEAEVATLPAAAQRYLRFMGAVGKPRDTTFRMHLQAKFQPKRDGHWREAEAWQFNSRPDVARLFHMTLRMFGVTVYGRDLYQGGRGRMLIRPLDLFTLQDERGEEFDAGELVTFLNDAVLLAPSMLLGEGVTFAAVADPALRDRAFDVSLADRGRTVKARVALDERGAPLDFETTDRFLERQRTRWTTPVDGWQRVGHRALPTSGRAVWHLPDGSEWAYAAMSFTPGCIAWNVAPGAPGPDEARRR